ncbi:uncharacterized protein SOCG_03727 [Schizosaccharomyces octosporus yFS286]|uniref:Uncharacterized protein n=1 Tax=Schizosaccharomyces octosporus (strain yFS286) TaxID=483514 RepID=S9QZW1_SCHOY|nr:uncharacterized protein SOCG_03727 [Schizosaccharomyces octosporus yFS286]EPX71790.1 hypothetical protein SOCG_03727 [Schizosaccharomyces octosporus yFS286]
MKNKYTPVSDSDESFKTLIDEKADTHSSDGTPPPYSASNKFIDLEMADGSVQNSAQESANNTRSDTSEKNKFQLTLIAYPGWFTQAGCNMCAAVLCTASLNVPCYSVYYFVKKIIGFEKMNDIAFYGVCFVNVAVFVLFWSTTDTRQLRIFIADLGNGMGNAMGSIGNDMLNSIRNAANYVRPTDPENEAPRNEEIELQPFAGQSAEV